MLQYALLRFIEGRSAKINQSVMSLRHKMN